MKTTIQKYSCDLCEHDIRRGNLPSDGKMRRVSVGYTDEAGHYNDSEKHICADCVTAINRAKEETVPK